MSFARVRPLGEKLVAELGLDDSVDTLGRWMAHYLSELIDKAQRVSPDAQAEAEERACNVILKLWEHRQSLPHRARPFADLEPVIDVLRSFSSADTPYYRSDVFRAARADPDTPSQPKWLGHARTVDRAARSLVDFSLRQAVKSAGSKSAKWITLVDGAGVSGADVQFMRFVLTLDDEDTKERIEARRRDGIAERLDLILKLEKVTAEIRKRLEKDLARIDEA